MNATKLVVTTTMIALTAFAAAPAVTAEPQYSVQDCISDSLDDGMCGTDNESNLLVETDDCRRAIQEEHGFETDEECEI